MEIYSILDCEATALRTLFHFVRNDNLSSRVSETNVAIQIVKRLVWSQAGLLHFVRNDGQGSLMSRPLPSTLRLTIRRRTKRRPFPYRRLIITGTETSRGLLIDILDCSDLSWSTSFCIIPNLNHTFHLDTSWKRSLRSIDSEPSLSSDEKDSVLSWS